MRRIVRKREGGVNLELGRMPANTEHYLAKVKRGLRTTERTLHKPTPSLRVCSAARLVFAARRRAIRLINENVVVTRRAHHAVDRLAELIVRSAAGVFVARLFSADGHALGSDVSTTTF